MPLDGYTAVFERLLGHPGIHIALNTDWFAVRDSLRRAVPIVYTGPIDRYFGYRYGRLGWRTTDFRQAVVPVADYQGTAIMNFADEEVAHTRIIEYRHFHPERAHPEDRSLIVHEYPRFATDHDEPFYPIDTREDRVLYHKYKERTEAEPNVYFGGRLGTYHYLDMHQAIGAALKEWERLKAAHFSR
jgi:UDP-galactopyranose mutase